MTNKQPGVSRWGEDPLPGDFNYVRIPGWVLRNLQYFVHQGYTVDRKTGKKSKHPDSGKEVGLTLAERMFFIQMMSFLQDREGAKLKVSLEIVAMYLGMSVRQVQNLKTQLVKKGALTVIENTGESSTYSFENLILQCRYHEIRHVRLGTKGYGIEKGKRAAERKNRANELWLEQLNNWTTSFHLSR